jgi:hypothetical protein
MAPAYDHSPHPFLATDAALSEFIQSFEQGTLPHAQWTHAAHLAMASWYLLSLPEPEAVERVRSGIRCYNEAVGTLNTPDSGYHETLTLFWLCILADFLGEAQSPRVKLAAIRRVVAQFGSCRSLYREYYSFDVARSREARAKWVRPDRPGNFPGNKNTPRDI